MSSSSLLWSLLWMWVMGRQAGITPDWSRWESKLRLWPFLLQERPVLRDWSDDQSSGFQKQPATSCVQSSMLKSWLREGQAGLLERQSWSQTAEKREEENSTLNWRVLFVYFLIQRKYQSLFALIHRWEAIYVLYICTLYSVRLWHWHEADFAGENGRHNLQLTTRRGAGPLFSALTLP